jgi:hypothetical protein
MEAFDGLPGGNEDSVLLDRRCTVGGKGKELIVSFPSIPLLRSPELYSSESFSSNFIIASGASNLSSSSFNRNDNARLDGFLRTTGAS